MIIPICLLISILYGNIVLAIITQRPELNGYMYELYDMSKLQYTACIGLISSLGFGIIFFTVMYLYQKNVRELTRTFWGFLLYIVFFILCDLYLQSRWIGQG